VFRFDHEQASAAAAAAAGSSSSLLLPPEEVEGDVEEGVIDWEYAHRELLMCETERCRKDPQEGCAAAVAMTPSLSWWLAKGLETKTRKASCTTSASASTSTTITPTAWGGDDHYAEWRAEEQRARITLRAKLFNNHQLPTTTMTSPLLSTPILPPPPDEDPHKGTDDGPEGYLCSLTSSSVTSEGVFELGPLAAAPLQPPTSVVDISRDYSWYTCGSYQVEGDLSPGGLQVGDGWSSHMCITG